MSLTNLLRGAVTLAAAATILTTSASAALATTAPAAQGSGNICVLSGMGGILAGLPINCRPR